MVGSKAKPTSKRPPPIGLANAEGMAVVEIGANKEKCHVHKALLVYHSEYFAKALNGRWIEAEQQVVTLEDVDCEAFYLFTHWIYNQQIPAARIVLRNIVQEPPHESPFDSTLLLVKAYALGDRILAPIFCREIHNAVVRLRDYRLSFPSAILPIVTYAFANIPTDSVILQYFVNTYCETWDPKSHGSVDEKALLRFPPIFTARVMKRFAYTRKAVYDCCYLEHASKEEEDSCNKAHMVFSNFGTGYGGFGELAPED